MEIFPAHVLFCMERITLCDKLHFESQALELLSLILSLESDRKPSCWMKPCKINGAVDEALDILRQEWKSPPTISRLARRVGLNECYLKNGFRRRTGMPIGEMVGYSNPSHFAVAFKKVHGHLPSYYTHRF